MKWEYIYSEVMILYRLCMYLNTNKLQVTINVTFGILNVLCLFRNKRAVIRLLWSRQGNSHFLVNFELPYVPFTASQRVLMAWRAMLLTHFHVSHFHIIPLPFETLYLGLPGPPHLCVFKGIFNGLRLFFSLFPLLQNIEKSFNLLSPVYSTLTFETLAFWYF